MNTIDRRILSKKVRDRRRALGMTQRELAGTNFTRGFVSQVENGIISPSLKSLEIIAQRLGANVSHFLDEDRFEDPIVVSHLLRVANDHISKKSFDEALIALQEALSIAVNMKDSSFSGRCYRALGVYYFTTSDFANAADNAEKSAKSYFAVEDFNEVSKSYNLAGSAWHLAGDHHKAVAAYHNGLQYISDKKTQHHHWLRLTINLALAYISCSQYDNALPLLESGLKEIIATSDYYRLGDVHSALGIVYRACNRHEDACKEYKFAYYFSMGVPDHLNAANANVNLGIVKTEMGELAEAQTLFEGAIATYSQMQKPELLANAQAELAKVAWKKDDFETALVLCESAIPAIVNAKERGRAMILQAKVLLQLQRELKRAAELITTGRDLVGSDATVEETADVYYDYGNILLRLGRAEEAGAYLSKAADAFRRLKR